MGKRGKRRRSRPRSEAPTTDDVKDREPDVIVTSDKPFPVAWDTNAVCNNDNILHPFWKSLEKRKRRTLTPTPIQLHVWPILMTESRQNVVGIAHTNSGKTMAYGLPILAGDGNAVVLVPTRELARQVEQELSSVPSKKEVICVYGGVDRETQVKAVQEVTKGSWIVAATPGRLVDILESCQELAVNTIILDEADRMALNKDMARQVDTILQHLENQHRPTMALFSATFPSQVEEQFIKWAGSSHVCIKVNTTTVVQEKHNKWKEEGEQQHTASGNEDEEDPATAKAAAALDMARIPEHVTQTLHVCAAHKKPRKLISTLSKLRAKEVEGGRGRHRGLCLVFFARIKTLQYICKLLRQEGFKVAELHSHLQQSVRETTLTNFKSGKVPTLLATDIAARGVHVKNIEYVINYDFPGSLGQYVHRCGRAGRDQSSQSSEATVYSFFTRDLAPMAKDVATLLQSSNAWVDPNLMSLVGSEPNKKKQKRHPKEKAPQTETNIKTAANSGWRTSPTEEMDENSDDDGDFANLCPNRTVLKRASHVSDASDSSSDSDSD